jgi:hypothetical protein
MGYLIDILIGVAGSLVAAELWARADLMAQWLVRGAVRRLPRNKRERRLEEWLADLHDVPSAFGKLSWAIGCHWAATVANGLRATAQKRKRQRKRQGRRKRLGARIDLIEASGAPSGSAIDLFLPVEHWRAIDRGAIKFGCSPETYLQAVVYVEIEDQQRKLKHAWFKNTLLRRFTIPKLPRDPQDHP